MVEAPSYFDERDWRGRESPLWTVELHCYVLGPSRHYRWSGPTLAAACELATEHVTEWVVELEART